MRRALVLFGFAVAFGFANGAAAGTLTVGSGAVVDLGSGTLDSGEGDVEIGGTLSAGTQGFDARDVEIQSAGMLNGESALIQLCGDWSNAGSFNAGTSDVAFVDGCSTTSSTISDANTFYGLTLATSTGKKIFFEAGATQTVSGAFSASGASGNLLEIRSTVDGTAAQLALAQGTTASYVDVKDNDNLGALVLLGTGSFDSGNSGGWSLPSMPALGLLGLTLLGVSLYATGRRSLQV